MAYMGHVIATCAVRQTCRLATPVQGDVWLRLLFKMLSQLVLSVPPSLTPQRYLLHLWLGAIETQQHAFYDCEVVHHERVACAMELLTASVLHLIWTQHNGVQCTDEQELPAAAWHDLSFVGWMASFRRWLRLQDDDDSERKDVLQVIGLLHVQPP
ncbi:hypothetical protein ACHHYP_20517 [Achlya hypogyna]|uniref:Uncharacterized protein n=1 Tax=Achlya hypogyna TaxID=1202772 RepID=A0A1V9YK03_ACHHY|nr:hypothetical protein ACHHYP_20517 [Achlya hypogyna]